MAVNEQSKIASERNARILKAQRERRAKYVRIDYYPSEKAGAVLDAHSGNYSSLISRIIEEWAQFRNS